MSSPSRPLIASLGGSIIVCAAASILQFITPPPAARATGQVPANCIEHTSFNGGTDYDGDYRCAGLAIEYHTGGVTQSPSLIWAGQWLLRDDKGAFRLGLCTFNRGIHPTIDAPSVPVTQELPNDAGGARAAYLTWKYGSTADNLTAAGLWALFHFYAQDDAGSNRAADPFAPLVPSLDRIGEASGRQDIEDRAVSLDAEAQRFSGAFALHVAIGSDGVGRVSVAAGSVPVEGVAVALSVEPGAFDDGLTSVAVTTDSNGIASFRVHGDVEEVVVTAIASVPGMVEVYRGAGATSALLPQTLLTEGLPTELSDSATVLLDLSTTTTSTVEATTTTIPAATTTTTIAPTTTITTTTTSTTSTTVAPSTTTTSEPTTATTDTDTVPTIPDVPITVATTPVPTPLPTTPSTSPLPQTGSRSNGAAYAGTALLVAGIGVLGAVRRRRPGIEEPFDFS